VQQDSKEDNHLPWYYHNTLLTSSFCSKSTASHHTLTTRDTCKPADNISCCK
jgi:hypothetical protein